MRWFLVVAGLLAVRTQAFAPITWTKFPARKFVLAPETRPSKALAPLLKLTIRESPEAVPHFTVAPDETITWDAMGLCLEAGSENHRDEVFLDHCADKPRQKWNVLPSSNGRQVIQLKGGTKCLEVIDKEGVSVELRECERKATQSWTFGERIQPQTEGSGRLFAFSTWHVVYSLIALVAIGMLSHSAWLWRLQIKEGPMGRASARLSADTGGISLYTRYAMIQDNKHRMTSATMVANSALAGAGEESSPSMSPTQKERRSQYPRNDTEDVLQIGATQVLQDNDALGVYTITHENATVSEGESIKSADRLLLLKGTTVTVQEVVEVNQEHRVRAKIEHPNGWITLRNTDTGHRWAEKVQEFASPRVRFAPSPTGVLHVGGARTALFNYIFAKRSGGSMILRIEDTDEARSTAESEAAIMEDLKWCGISWDEGPDVGGPNGPYRQSERLKAGIYKEQLDKLMASGRVYRCFMSAEELDNLRREAEASFKPFLLESPWATATEVQIQEMLDDGKPYVYRFRVPRDEIVEIQDLVVGTVKWNTNDIGGDFVIVRETGTPLYNFAAVVDDGQMKITHVLRAQEHLGNTPKQVLLYQALGLEIPKFCHMPLILAPDKSKLSKRHGAVSVGAYKDMGCLPIGMVNYLSLLGWSDGTDKEVYEIEELVDSFTLERMGQVNSIFDKEKLKWVNSQHIKLLPDSEAISVIGEELVREGIVKEASGDFVANAVTVLKERIFLLPEAGEALKKILAYPLKETLAAEDVKPLLDDASISGTAKAIAAAHRSGELDKVATDPSLFGPFVKSIADEIGLKKKKVFLPCRICLTGASAGPSLDLTLQLLRSIDDNVICAYVPMNKRIEELSDAMGL